MDVTARMTYLEWQDLYSTEKPFQIFVSVDAAAGENIRDTNIVFGQGTEEIIHDCRGKEGDFTLDEHGFSFVTHHSQMVSWDDADTVKEVYLKEVEELLRQQVDDVGQVFFFDWRIRRSSVDETPGRLINFNDKLDVLAPAIHVHVDQTPTAVLKRVQVQCPVGMLSNRVRVINAWRPLRGPVKQWPLAICDARTVQQSDLVAADHVRKHYTGETYYVKQSPGFVWHYLSNQLPYEVLLFKNFDSLEGKSQCCPHSSFQLPVSEEDAPFRESIEVRALVFSRN
ncbi:hypothetical protein B0T24DRAFT_656821 [Lasiosphaeria ovina]|uniref:Methyltransferase n=1 Tax=Lasiosphaeria ovina TaxID=92902 RepID=A0AAE0NAV0_9PEZI|nr:hypothetical protein B0T24DRAFT_656821 [Lasiosphaeria ovina]